MIRGIIAGLRAGKNTWEKGPLIIGIHRCLPEQPLISGCGIIGEHGHVGYGWQLRLRRRRALTVGSPLIRRMPRDWTTRHRRARRAW